MYLDHRVTARIARILNMVDMSALLLDASGNVILPEGDPRVFTLPDGVRQNPSKPLVYGGFTLIGTNDEQPIFVVLQGNSQETEKCAMLCAELINVLLREDIAQTSREQALRLMLRGEVDPGEYEGLATDHGIDAEGERCVMYLYLQEMEAQSALRVLESLIVPETDLLTEVGRHAIALVRTLQGETAYEELIEYADAIENTFATEGGKEILIGISEVHDDLEGLHEAFEEARGAISVGRIYHANKTLFVYRNLLLERFLKEVKSETSVRYNSQIFNRKTTRLFNDEMIHTIETFFDNSLNLSETARKLYIHRNTLVYRLEKVQRAIGLDLRNFDDAVTFKMMMLLGKNTTARKLRLQ